MAAIRYSVTDNELIEAVKNDSQWAINQLYIKYVGVIKSYLRNKGASEEQAIECYHDTMMSVLKLARTGMLDENEGTVEPFFKKVSWYSWHKMLRKQKGEVIYDTDRLTNAEKEGEASVLTTMVSGEVSEERLNKLQRAFDALSERCKAILELGFFANPPYSANEIAELLDLANANTARVTKANCIKSLRKHYFD